MATRAFKYRLYPDYEQETLIRKTIGCARLTYNLLLEDYKQQLNNGVKPVIKEVTFFKPSFPFLSGVDSLALANAKQNLKQAFTNFFDSKNGKRKGKLYRFPKRHKKSKAKLSYTTNNQGGNIRIEGNSIKLPKLGFVRVKEHTPLRGNIRSVTVCQERNDTFYVSILCEYEPKTFVRHKSVNDLRVVGLDMSYSDFAVSSDNNKDDTKPKYIRQYRTNERRRARLNRRVSRCKIGSKNRNKARIKLANLDRYIANARKDFCHKLSRYYVNNYDVIVLEDINMQDQQRALHNGKSVGDLGFGMFKSFLSYKCEDNDVALVYADKWFPSSKTCNHCGYVNKELTLSDRKWVCPECGEIIDRDYNAACNLRDYFYKIISTAGTAGIYACGDAASTLRETLKQVVSLNQEAPPFRWWQFTIIYVIRC
jgi:putative transposase